MLAEHCLLYFWTSDVYWLNWCLLRIGVGTCPRLGIRVIRDISGSIKINCDARRALSIVVLNLRFLLIELMFATRSRLQLNQVNQKTIKREFCCSESNVFRLFYLLMIRVLLIFATHRCRVFSMILNDLRWYFCYALDGIGLRIDTDLHGS